MRALAAGYFGLLICSCAVVEAPREPEQEEGVIVSIFPTHFQSYTKAPRWVSLALEGELNATRPVELVLEAIELVELSTGESRPLTRKEPTQDETYRGAEVMQFSSPELGDGEYEVIAKLRKWGPRLVPKWGVEEDAMFRSRFIISARAFFANSVTICRRHEVIIDFSEPVLGFKAEDLSSRVLLLQGDEPIPCFAKGDSEDGLLGGSTLELLCTKEVTSPFSVMFSEVRSAEGKKHLARRSHPEVPVDTLHFDESREEDEAGCAGWGAP